MPAKKCGFRPAFTAVDVGLALVRSRAGLRPGVDCYDMFCAPFCWKQRNSPQNHAMSAESANCRKSRAQFSDFCSGLLRQTFPLSFTDASSVAKLRSFATVA